MARLINLLCISFTVFATHAKAQDSSRPGRITVEGDSVRCLDFLPDHLLPRECRDTPSTGSIISAEPSSNIANPSPITNTQQPTNVLASAVIITNGSCGSLGGLRYVANPNRNTSVLATIRERITHNGNTSTNDRTIQVAAGGRVLLGCSTERPATGFGVLRRYYTVLGTQPTG